MSVPRIAGAAGPAQSKSTRYDGRLDAGKFAVSWFAARTLTFS